MVLGLREVSQGKGNNECKRWLAAHTEADAAAQSHAGNF